MIKKLLLSTAVLTGGLVSASHAQNAATCYTDEMRRLAEQQYPEQIAKSEAKWKQIIDASLSKMDLSQYAKTTFTGRDTTTVYHIPLVFHLVHNYGTEFAGLTDNQVYEAVKQINEAYNRMNADTSVVIAPFKGLIRGTGTKYIGKTKFVFHLAQKDPMGQPTNGITRQRHYLTLKGGDLGKLGGWAPDSYVNIWINTYITNSRAAAYAYQPTTIDNNAALKVVDGIMVAYQATISSFGTINGDQTISHELGHYFSLAHVWGNTNDPNVRCGDDGVFDTPPTKGHSGGGCNSPSAIYDTTCTLTGAIMGKVELDSVTKKTDTLTNSGISFDAYSLFYLNSIDIYSGADSGAAYAIQLTRNGNPVYLYQDTFRVRKGTKLTLPLNWKIGAGDGYKMSFLRNPGAYADTNRLLLPYRKISGAVYFTSNDTAQGQTYRYFYNWKMKYGFFRIMDSSEYSSFYVYNAAGTIPSQAIPLPDGGFLVDYADTTNSQNIMDYTGCSKMFSDGQAQRMRLSASSPIADRNKLSTTANLIRTGIMDANGNILPRQDVRPVADFSVQRYNSIDERLFVAPGIYNYGDIVYKCTGETFTFNNRTTGDTVNNNDLVEWTFSNGASQPTSTSHLPNIQTSFSQPGWATVSLRVQTNAGADTETRQPVYVADANNKIAPIGYFQDFNPGSDMDRWPVFNYYNNSFKWEPVNNVGGYDQTSMKYNTYDYRYGVQNPIASLPGSSPEGDFDDFFSPPFDLTGLNNGGNLNLNFLYAGASRSSVSDEINDTFQVYASTDCGNTWRSIDVMGKRTLNNNGVISTPFTPTGLWNWKPRSIDLRPFVNSGTNSIMFRFRYRPGVIPTPESAGPRLGSGNNFYIDRIHVSNNGLGVNDQLLAERGMVLAPNPTNAGTSIYLKNANGDVNVTISDITGKVVYRATTQGTGSLTTIEIPASAVAVKGIYVVQVASSGLNHTEKLVVN